MFDFIKNGVPHGDIATRFVQSGGDPNVFRPYFGSDGRSYINQKVNGKVVAIRADNVTTTLRTDEWKKIDDVVVRVSKERLSAVNDLRSRGLQYTIPNGMGTTVLQTDTQSDINDADVSMDGLRKNANDRPVYEPTYLPLPIIHKDFSFSARQILASRNGTTPLDTETAALATRKVAERAEKMLLGVSTVGNEYPYAAGTIYGYTDYTHALTKTITQPSGIAGDGATLLEELLAMRTQAQAAYHYGPYMIYVAPNWDQYLDNDFKANGTVSVRNRIKETQGFEDVKTLDYLTDYDIVMVQMTSDVVRMVIGMEIITLQWPSDGGLQSNFKVMAIMVPQLRADQNDNTGIVYGTV